MKNIRYLFLYGLLISLAGCYNSVVRFWNGDGYYPSAAYRKASHECIASLQKISPTPQNENIASEQAEHRRAYEAKWISECTQNKLSK